MTRADIAFIAILAVSVVVLTGLFFLGGGFNEHKEVESDLKALAKQQPFVRTDDLLRWHQAGRPKVAVPQLATLGRPTRDLPNAAFPPAPVTTDTLLTARQAVAGGLALPTPSN